MSPKAITSEEAAAAVGITRQTLQAWIAKRKLVAPRIRVRGRYAARLWTESDIARLRRAKERIYAKGRTGRPRKRK